MHGRLLISFPTYSTFSPDTSHAETLLGWIGSTDSIDLDSPVRCTCGTPKND
jgi:hypothetical protein